MTESSVFAGFSKVWVGGGTVADTLWTTASNWSPSGTPSSFDNVFIPNTTFGSAISEYSALVTDLYLAPGASLTVNGSGTLVTLGNVFAGDSINGAGQLILSGPGKSVAGKFANLSITGAYTAIGNVVVLGDTIILGSLTVAGKNMDFRGAFIVNNIGVLVMANPSDYVQIAGTAYWSGGLQDGKLTEGTIELPGDFYQTNAGGHSDSFRATLNHMVKFVGTADQTVFIEGASSQFWNLNIANNVTGGNGVSVSSLTFAAGRLSLNSGSKLTLNGFLKYGTVTNSGAAIVNPSFLGQLFGPAPIINGVGPNSGVQGQTLIVTIGGTDFIPAATTVTLAGTGVTASSVVVQPDGLLLTALFAVNSAATAGARDVTVSTAGGPSHAVSFTVTGP